MNLRHLQRAPFRLDARALAWVEATFAELTPRGRRAQLIVPLAVDTSAANLERFAAVGVGGLYRLQNRAMAALRAEAAQLQAASIVPMLLCGDLEFGEDAAIGGAEGTAFPNQLAAAAAGGRAVERMATVAALEGGAAGYNWSFTPVSDLDFNPLNPVVSTRCFGNVPGRVAPLVQRYVETMQRAGMAACVKHWPGDGIDDRDQHHVTSVNSLPFAEWDRTYGRVYRAAIRGGVLSVMSGHIALPGWRGAGLVPASLSPELNLGLLRGRFGFNGVIISDATCMAGLTVHGPREELVPQLIANGCDLVLFPVDPELDLDYLGRAVATGRLTQERVNAAVLRVLAMKAALGLHRPGPAPKALDRAVRRKHAGWAEETAKRAVTRVRDDSKLVPLDPRRHRRVLLIQQKSRRHWSGSLPELQIDRLLREQGFAVELLRDESDVRPEKFDVALYVVAQEAGLGKTTLSVGWQELMGDFRLSMLRTWPELPTVFVSLGHPWHGREVTGCPTVINAYSPVVTVQEAVVAALVGKSRIVGRSPVRFGAKGDSAPKGTAVAGWRGGWSARRRDPG
jgi:beta-N-acetylhexosaminidase